MMITSILTMHNKSEEQINIDKYRVTAILYNFTEHHFEMCENIFNINVSLDNR